MSEQRVGRERVRDVDWSALASPRAVVVVLIVCGFFSSAMLLTRLVSIAPGALGVREGIVAGVASVLGFEAGVSAVAVGLDRLVATAVIIALGTVYSYVLGKKVAECGAVDGEEE